MLEVVAVKSQVFALGAHPMSSMLAEKEGLNVNAMPWSASANTNAAPHQSLTDQHTKSESRGSITPPLVADEGPPRVHRTQSESSLERYQGPPKLQMCKFYATGGCFKGEDCPYSHDLRVEAPVGVDASAGFIFDGKVANLHQAPPGPSPPGKHRDWSRNPHTGEVLFDGRQTWQGGSFGYDPRDEEALLFSGGGSVHGQNQQQTVGYTASWSRRSNEDAEGNEAQQLFFNGEQHSLRRSNGPILFGGGGNSGNGSRVSPPSGPIGFSDHVGSAGEDVDHQHVTDQGTMGSLNLAAFAELLTGQKEQNTASSEIENGHSLAPREELIGHGHNRTPPELGLEKLPPPINSDALFPSLPGTSTGSAQSSRLPQPRKAKQAAQQTQPSPAQLLNDAPALPPTAPSSNSYAGRVVAERADRRPTVGKEASKAAPSGSNQQQQQQQQRPTSGKSSQPTYSGRGRGRGRRD